MLSEHEMRRLVQHVQKTKADYHTPQWAVVLLLESILVWDTMEEVLYRNKWETRENANHKNG